MTRWPMTIGLAHQMGSFFRIRTTDKMDVAKPRITKRPFDRRKGTYALYQLDKSKLSIKR